MGPGCVIEGEPFPYVAMSRWLFVFCLFLPAVTVAQWPTTQWNVVCTDATLASIEASLLAEGASPGEAQEGAQRECDDSVTTPASAAALARLDLETSSEWYSNLRFRTPVVEFVDEHYMAYLADELIGSPDAIGVYDWDLEKMLMRSTFYIEVDSTGGTSGGIRPTAGREPACENPPSRGAGGGSTAVYSGVETVVHELFHAIQMNYDSSSSADSWISEGTAEGATLGWIRKSRGIRGQYSVPDLSNSLHIPEGATANQRYDAGYWRADFWFRIGEIIDPDNYIGYVEPLLRENLETRHGLGGVHEGLKAWHSDGMYYYYPLFIAEAGEARYQYTQTGCSSLDIAFAGGTIEREMPATVKPVAAHHHRIIVNDALAEEAYGIVVEIESDHPDLHLAIGPLLFNTGEGGVRRNRFQTVMIGDGDPDTLMVRVANIAPEPTSSRERSYTLKVRLGRVDPCSEYALVAPLNPSSAEARTHVQLAEAFRRYQLATDTEEVVYPLGEASLNVAGDGGSACISHFGVSDLEWTSEQEEDFDYEGTRDDVIARNMPRAVAETGFTEGEIRAIIDEGTMPAGATREQIMTLMRIIREAAAQPLTDDAERSGVLFHIFAPNLIAVLAGGVSSESLSNEDNVVTRHGGVGGWQANSAANLIVYMPGTRASEIEGGQTFEAIAYALAPEDDDTPPPGPKTSTVVYTTWDGTWKNLTCNGITDSYFVGTQTTNWGRLSGSVTIENVTPASIEGSFSLSGPGTREVVAHRQERSNPYNPRCPYSVQVDEDSSSSAISATGNFSAPNFHGPGTVTVAGVGRAAPMGQ